MRRGFAVLAFLAACLPANAASFFSAGQPVGEEFRPVVGASRGMAGVSLAMNDPNNLSLVNPAGLASVRKGTVSFLFSQEFIKIRDERASAWNSATEIPMIVLAVPVENLATLTGAYHQVSRLDFQVSSGQELISGTDSVTQSLEGSGARYAGFVGLSRIWTRWLQTGLAYERIAGNTKTTLAADFNSATAWDRFDTTSLVPGGNRVGLGAIFTLAEARFALAAYIPFKTSAEQKQFQTIISPSRVSVTSQTSQDIEETLPATYSLGASYGMGRTRAGLDVSLSPWDDYSRTGFSNDLRSDLYVGLGVRRDISENQFETRWYRILPVRAGIFFHRWPNPGVNEYGFATGIGLPLASRAGLFDISVELARRGSVEEVGLVENSVKVTIGITGNSRAVGSKSR